MEVGGLKNFALIDPPPNCKFDVRVMDTIVERSSHLESIYLQSFFEASEDLRSQCFRLLLDVIRGNEGPLEQIWLGRAGFNKQANIEIVEALAQATKLEELFYLEMSEESSEETQSDPKW